MDNEEYLRIHGYLDRERAERLLDDIELLHDENLMLEEELAVTEQNLNEAMDTIHQLEKAK